MSRYRCIKGLVAAIIVLSAGDHRAHAEDESEIRFGLGGEIAGTGAAGLGLRAWFGRFGVQAMTSFESFEGGGQSATRFELGARLAWQIVRLGDTHLVGGFGAFWQIGNPGVAEGRVGAGGDDVATTLELSLAIEHYFGRHFSVAGLIALPIRLGHTITVPTFDGEAESFEGSLVTLGSTSWGGQFTIYF